MRKNLIPAASTRPSGGLRRVMTRLWESWVYWAYGATFDRQTERKAPEAGLQLFESRFVYDELHEDEIGQ